MKTQSSPPAFLIIMLTGFSLNINAQQGVTKYGTSVLSNIHPTGYTIAPSDTMDLTQIQGA